MLANILFFKKKLKSEQKAQIPKEAIKYFQKWSVAQKITVMELAFQQLSNHVAEYAFGLAWCLIWSSCVTDEWWCFLKGEET